VPDLPAWYRGLSFSMPSLLDLLSARVAVSPDAVIYRYLAEGEVEESVLTCAELDHRARAIAAELQLAGLEGERALLLYPPGLEFITAFFGCLYAGTVAVPAYPPRIGRAQARLRAITRNCRPAAALTTARILSRARRASAEVPELENAFWLSTDSLPVKSVDGWRRPQVTSGSLAFLQYTSGSTGAPKGVMVSHANLLHNQEMTRQAFGITAESVIVGWLPLFHDMGLIGNVLQPVYAGASCILISPTAFLQSPRRWLRAISEYRATVSGGPNFGYELCVDRIPEEQREGLDLSSWQVAFNGAEPVRARTLERFAEAFAVCGFRRAALFPCYGLAEATLLVSAGSTAAPPVVEAFDGPELERGRAEPAAAAEGRRRDLVGCGHAWSGQEIAIVDPESGRLCPPDQVGEVWVAGSSVALGYWERPEETELMFRGRTADGRGPFLRTGDLGILREGELFVTGRIKDLVILRGRNHYPQDIEATAERSHPALRPGCGAAFAVEGENGERLILVWELAPTAVADAGQVAEAVRRAVAEEHEIGVHEVVLLAAGACPRTSSGKVQRHACREGYLTNGLAAVARVPLGGGWVEERTGEEAGPDLPLLRGSDPRSCSLVVAEILRREVRRLLGTAPSGPEVALTSLGLDSLSAVELQGAVDRVLGVAPPLSALLRGAGLRELAEDLSERLTAGGSADEPVSTHASSGPGAGFPLSWGQRGLWFLERLAPGNAAYHVAVAARSRGRLDAGALSGALQDLARRHPTLRTTFHDAGETPEQRIEDEMPVELQTEDATGWSERQLHSYLRELMARPFDLEVGPPVRATVLAWRPESDVVLLAAHHLVVDFWSAALLLEDLGALYTARALGSLAALAPIDVTVADYVEWQRAYLESPRGEEDWAYWRERLAPPREPMELPTDRPRPAAQTQRGAAETFALEPLLATRLRELGRSRGATLYTVLLAAFQALLHRTTQALDLFVGSPTSGRGRNRFSGLAGYLVNPVVLRTHLGDDPPAGDLVERVRETVLGALQHQDFPFPLLVERLQADRDPSRTPLFQVMFVLHQVPRFADPELAVSVVAEGRRLNLGTLALESLAVEDPGTAFDLTLTMAEVDGGLHGRITYNADLFEAVSVQAFAARLATLLSATAGEPLRPVSALSILSAAERHQLCVEWSRGSEQAASGERLHDLFEAQAERTPGAVALIWREQALTYAELERRANQLARHLRSLGVGPEERVGVMLGRTPDLVISLLAVLKAGGAYVALDPSYPRERLALILGDAKIAALVTRPELVVAVLGELRGDLHPVLVDAQSPEVASRSPEPLARRASSEHLAYLVYTSGSTGRPKGVAIPHRATVALVRWAREIFSDCELAGVLAGTSFGFDLAVFEVFVPLAWGGTVILADNALALASLPAASRVTLVNTVPSVIAELLELEALPAAGVTVNLAGEALAGTLARRLHERPAVRRLLNLYGPSETTTYSTFAVVMPGQERIPPIGRPIAGTRVHLLSPPALEPVPLGATGELYIGGAGLARGYHDRPDLTAERFVPDPFSPTPGGRLYQTGDLARLRPQGELEFLGRGDHQVKIRGFRIELGEVESALEAHPAIRQAVVVARTGSAGDRHLVAYLTFAGDPLAAAELRQLLGRTLPAYMIPAAFVSLKAFPLSPNGKVDRPALPVPNPEGERLSELMPRNQIEELLAGIWADVLGCDRVGIDDDFFALGGHSLLASRILSRIGLTLGVELPLGVLFQARTIATLAEWIERSGGEPPPPWGSAPRVQPLPLSFAQQRLWFLYRMEPESAAYNVPGAVRLSGALRVGALVAALQEGARRHESLRTAFSGEGEPRQEIAPEVRIVLPMIDLAALPARACRGESEALLQQQAARPFDLMRPPLLRAGLFRLREEEHLLLLTMHHIVSDGLSLQVLLRELAALYDAAVAGRPSPLPPAPQYADFALWQRSVLSGERLERLLAYWRERLAGMPVLELPTDWPRSAVSGARARTRRLEIPMGLLERLRAASRSQGITLFMTLVGAFAALLARHSGEDDFAVGSPVATRGRLETEGMVGLLVNTLVLRADLTGDPAVAEVLRRLRQVVLGAHAHQDLPFERLVEELQPDRALGRLPLFQVMFAFFNAAETVPGFAGLQTTPLDVDNGTAKFDLTALVKEEPDTLHVALVYRRELFEAVTVDRLGAHYVRLLEGMLAVPGKRLSELPLLSAAERQQLVREWVSPPLAVPRDRTLHELFAEQARRTPGRPAVVFRDEHLTYGELDRRADALAHELRAQGIGPESLVGLYVERSVDSVVGILGVLKAGGAYLPLDPEYPRDRLTFMLEDSGAQVLLTQEHLLQRLRPVAARIVLLDRLAACAPAAEEVPELTVSPGNLAYVIYTSGSTGRPKGTLIEHRSVVNLACVLRLAVYTGRPEPLRVSLNASIAFDASVKQIVQLLHGHTLHVVPEEVRQDGERLVEFLRRQPLDVLDCTPSQLNLLLASGLLTDIGPAAPVLALVGGEPISEGLWRRLAANESTRFYNVYGPTECTVDATAWAIGTDAERPTLGRPLANVRVHLLDRRLGAVPVGVPGELCIAGPGVARGYLNQPDLTAERFVPDPTGAEPGGRMYRTGDLGRYLPNGRIESLGRADHQVKVRGLRVELGEIEARLELHPGVDRAVAIPREDTPGDQRLVAYFTGSEGVTDSDLRQFLRRDLPDAMIPSAFVRLAALPLSAHGKVDRGRLPSPTTALERDFVAPRTPLEKSLAQLWAELLRLDRVGIRDNFFELGGHSLLVLKLVARIRQTLGLEAPARTIFEHPTIAELAPLLATPVAVPVAVPVAAPGPVRRGGLGNFGQLLAEIRSLSPEEARRRLAEPERPGEKS
jgi:amino acid adenylation domain-containing protein